MDPTHEQTLVLIKPDALKLSLTGYLLSTLSETHTGLRLAGAKIVHVSDMLAQEHYAEHRAKPFFDNLCDYLTGRIHYPEESHRRRVVALVYHGTDAILRVRKRAGPTNPHAARDRSPGTIRALGTLVMGHNDVGREYIERIDNLIHTSADATDAEREIKLWFRPNDIMPYMQDYRTEICEKHYYYHDGILSAEHRTGDTCLLAPGDPAWESDLAVLRAIIAGETVDVSLESVAVKYLINTYVQT